VARVALFSWRFVIPLIFFVYCYWKIISALRRSAQVGNDSRTINVRQRQQHAAGPSTSDAAAEAGTSSHSKPLSSSQKNVIKTMIVVTSFFIVCWLPLQFMILAFVCGLQAFSSLTLYYALVVIAFVNLCANPFIYATGLYQSLRVKITAILYHLRHRAVPVTESQDHCPILPSTPPGCTSH